jgi:hypothetical protein
MGGKLINLGYKAWPIPVIQAALQAAKQLQLDWCAIDAATDKAGSVVVFEANTAPGLRNPYTIKQIGKTLAWIDKNGTPKEQKGEKWQRFLHPALRPER